ncbi:unnamed protein product [Heligmosomoides polygyrus]|uniref:Uncharacterized protein n=1 Tax=Heligmosomoides polygyrus TaxID=6339 RepID=A0A183GIC5_HELPZ|nr:unnamed protein product [Heligmosomoides polygyrus]
MLLVLQERRSDGNLSHAARRYPEECDDWILYSKTDCSEGIEEQESKKKEEPKRNTPPATEASEKSEELDNKAAEDIALQIEADEEEGDLEREMIEANHEFMEMIDEVGEDDGAS